MIRAVLDTNVVVAAVINRNGSPAQVVRAAGTRFELVWTPAIAIECYRAIEYPRVARLLRGGVGDARRVVTELAAIASMVDPDRLPPLRVAGSDSDDDVPFATALAGGAGFVVSGDAAVLEAHAVAGILAVSPAEFLTGLGEG